MSHDPHHLKSLMHDYFHRAYTLGDASVIDELIAPNAICHGLSPEPTHSRDDFKKWYYAFHSSFSNIACSLTHCIVEGDWVACRVHLTATHTGPNLGPPPSHKRVSLSALILLRIHNGQVVEGFNELNQLTLLQQIGVA